MHETGLLAAAVGDIVAANGTRPIIRIDLALGPGTDEEVTLRAWRQAATGTVAEDAVVNMSRATDTLHCLECGETYAGDRLTPCPRCDGTGLVVRPAPELEILGWSAAPQPSASR